MALRGPINEEDYALGFRNGMVLGTILGGLLCAGFVMLMTVIYGAS